MKRKIWQRVKINWYTWDVQFTTITKIQVFENWYIQYYCWWKQDSTPDNDIYRPTQEELDLYFLSP